MNEILLLVIVGWILVILEMFIIQYFADKNRELRGDIRFFKDIAEIYSDSEKEKIMDKDASLCDKCWKKI